MRIRRSLAFCRCIEPDGVRMLLGTNVDCVVLDLEDGVVVTKKAENHAATAKALQEWDFKSKERVLRINGPHTPFYQADLDVIRQGRPDAVRLPKCEDAAYVMRVADDLTAIEKELGLPEDGIELILMIENPIGIMNTHAMCSCRKRVTAAGVGMEDLTAAMGIERRYVLNCLDLIYARQKVVLEAKAAGVQALDSNVLFHASGEYMAEESLISRRMGFDGRSCSVRYPDHIDIVNKAYTPSEEQVQWASEVAAAYEDAVQKGTSNVYVNGLFIDPPVVAKARTILDFMRQIGARAC